MLIDSFANRLDLALKRNNMRPIDLANKTHIDKSSISRYLSGDWKASQKRLTLIAMALNTNEAWLMGYDVSDAPNKSHINYKDYDAVRNKSNSLTLEEKKEKMLDYMNKYNIESLSPIPVYSRINEKGFKLVDKFIDEYITIDTKLYNIDSPQNFFYVKIADDSMNKKYQEGDYILMKKSSNIKNDTIALISLDNTTLIRKITLQGDLLLLEPLSSTTKYKTQACPKESVKILGTVIGYIGYERSN